MFPQKCARVVCPGGGGGGGNKNKRLDFENKNTCRLGLKSLRSPKPDLTVIGLASDDVTKHSNAWQRGNLVLNKGSAPYKSMLEESLSLGEALYFFVERFEWF